SATTSSRTILAPDFAPRWVFGVSALILADRPAPSSPSPGRRSGEIAAENLMRRSGFHLVPNDDAVTPRPLGLIQGSVCGSQHRLPRRVAERVVEALEVVDVDHHYAEGQGAAPGAALFPAERLLEVAAVMEAGQPVMYDLVLQAQVCLRQFLLRQ